MFVLNVTTNGKPLISTIIARKYYFEDRYVCSIRYLNYLKIMSCANLLNSKIKFSPFHLNSKQLWVHHLCFNTSQNQKLIINLYPHLIWFLPPFYGFGVFYVETLRMSPEKQTKEKQQQQKNIFYVAF